MQMSKIFGGLSIILIYVVAINSLIYSFNDFGLFLIIFASICSLFWLKGINGNYTNISLVFIAFSILYGVSGPISVVWGEGLHRIFSQPYNTASFLIGYTMANIGFILGVLIFNLINVERNTMDTIISNYSMKIGTYEKLFVRFSLLFALSASVSEIVNLIRVGGIASLFSGKAFYQSAISALTLTFPSNEFMIIGFSLISIAIGNMIYNKRFSFKKSKINLFLILSAPYLVVTMILGDRSSILTLFLCVIFGITYFKPIKKIEGKLIIILLIVYLFMAFLFANRSIAYLILDNPSEFIDIAFQRERIVKALNPGANEFGAAFGNFSEYYNKYNNNFQPKLGSTYLKGLVIPIPSFIYPGDKPQQITYQFRDEFFASEASRGAIAGTGFSSILEAYMNLNFIGILIVYMIIGYFLQKIDKQYRYKSLFTGLLYVSVVSQAMSFHRSQFGLIYANVFLRAVLIFVIVQSMRIYLKRYFPNKNKNRGES